MFSRTRAPELSGRGWLNTGGQSLRLSDLQGKIVLLDFWTFCCINCLHILDELRPLEERYRDVMVMIGVHSPKFEHEKDASALAAAIDRHDVRHAVLDDPEMTTWMQYGVRAWPTLTVIDPEGYVVGQMSGEGHARHLVGVLDGLVAKHRAKGTLSLDPLISMYGSASLERRLPETVRRPLWFPSKAISSPSGTFYVTSSARHQIIEMASDGETLLRSIGSGERGFDDGDPEVATFSEPSGMCWLPPAVASNVGYDLVVADTVNHALRGIDSSTGTVTTVAGTGRQWRGDITTTDAREQDMSSPWDVEWHEGRVIIAMAGIHQLWWFDPTSSTAGPYAGTGVESIRDGHVTRAFMAQPSGLSSDGRRLWIADSETSSLRWIEDDHLHTAIGSGLFDFGHADGVAPDALLQHPLGVLAIDDRTVLVADTYNGAVRKYDPIEDVVTTVADGLIEPSDLVVGPNGKVLVVESGAHSLSKFDTADETRFDGSTISTREISLRPGDVMLTVSFDVPVGQKLDDSFGSPVQMEISSSPPTLLLSGAGGHDALTRKLRLDSSLRQGTIDVRARVATCDAKAAHPACHLSERQWSIAVTLEGHGSSKIELDFVD